MRPGIASSINPLTASRGDLKRVHDGGSREEAHRAEQVEEEQDVGQCHDPPTISLCRRPTAICGC
jgi:hypothetical protein